MLPMYQQGSDHPGCFGSNLKDHLLFKACVPDIAQVFGIE